MGTTSCDYRNCGLERSLFYGEKSLESRYVPPHTCSDTSRPSMLESRWAYVLRCVYSEVDMYTYCGTLEGQLIPAEADDNEGRNQRRPPTHWGPLLPTI